MTITHYEPTERKFRTPILFVYSLINRYYILDFLPGRIFRDATLPDQTPAERAAIYDELYALSREFSTGPGDRRGIPIVTPSQVGKGAFGKAVVTADMLAGALAKAMIADIILPICQTWEERRMQPFPVMRLFRAKVREAEGLGMVWFDQDKDRMLLVERAPIALKADKEE